jgi:hypothetical protein
MPGLDCSPGLEYLKQTLIVEQTAINVSFTERFSTGAVDLDLALTDD